MWILPKQLHTLVCAPDTEDLISDLNEQSQACEQSLLVRSKHTPARTWLRKWKRDSWTQHLSGRMLKPSLGNHFATEWICYLVDTHASPLAVQENELEQKTPGTCGHTSQRELLSCDPRSAFLRTSRDILALDYERLSLTWKAWVTEQRGAYSRRKNAGHHTGGNECLSWPTAAARDWKDTINGTHPPSRPSLSEQTLGQAVSMIAGQQGQWRSSTPGNRPGLLNPAWVENLMGLPIGWTDCGFSETE